MLVFDLMKIAKVSMTVTVPEGDISGGARECQRREPLGGSENFEIQRLGNVISSVL